MLAHPVGGPGESHPLCSVLHEREIESCRCRDTGTRHTKSPFAWIYLEGELCMFNGVYYGVAKSCL